MAPRTARAPYAYQPAPGVPCAYRVPCTVAPQVATALHRLAKCAPAATVGLGQTDARWKKAWAAAVSSAVEPAPDQQEVRLANPNPNPNPNPNHDQQEVRLAALCSAAPAPAPAP